MGKGENLEAATRDGRTPQDLFPGIIMAGPSTLRPSPYSETLVDKGVKLKPVMRVRWHSRTIGRPQTYYKPPK